MDGQNGAWWPIRWQGFLRFLVLMFMFSKFIGFVITKYIYINVRSNFADSYVMTLGFDASYDVCNEEFVNMVVLEGRAFYMVE